jgi:aminopeptidase YwaD
MSTHTLSHKAADYLRTLCHDIPTRRVGSAGNRQATDFFARTMAGFDLTTDCTPFDCMDWQTDGADLSADDTVFTVCASPYTRGVRARAPLVVVSTLAKLEAADTSGRLLLLRGAIAREPLMPKNFTFYNPDEHKHIYRLLESQQPRAIITATGRSPELAGGAYPFPMIEDGDFDIPSAYMTEEEGERLAGYAGRTLTLDIRAERRPSHGCNVTAHTRGGERRVVVFAHIDAKDGTPGALDNATGVTTLLLLGDLLADHAGALTVELVAMNGEDYYSAPGEQLYLRCNEGKFGSIALGINLDGLGYRAGKTAYALYGCPPALATRIDTAMAAHDELIPGEPWYQGDHGLFLMHDLPALAITSEDIVTLTTQITHTAQDTLDQVDVEKLVTTAHALRDVIGRLA